VKKKYKLFLPLIAYGGVCYVDYAMSLMSFVLKCKAKGIDLSIHPITFESLISRGRNASIAFALQDPDYTHVIFFDADVVFSADDAVRLLEADKDVCVGTYPKKYLNETKVLTALETLKGPKKKDWALYSTDFSTEITKESIAGVLRGDRTVEVDYAATGFMCIKTRVFKKIVRERPDLKYTNDIDGYTGGGDNFYDFFSVGVNPVSKKYESEDYGFCQLWRSLGGKIDLIPDITLTHRGTQGYSGNLNKQISHYYGNVIKPAG